ncbi:MAG: endolytic transglycosylase MltG [Proteobacteria bacterium]|nr:endolytic transglycosylase MltG [Pseudomonadota bacterium]MDA0952238.1 endolytic transglycosylase MltG [Pseudomonadota bacterium]MDA1072704.1 endolytic transglycosylase MltG [Pseudomonadota bacterium]
MGRGAGRLFSFFALILVVAAAAALWFQSASTSPGPLEEPATVIVPSGSGLQIIADELRAQGVIDSPMVLMLRARWLGQAHRFKAGEYAFELGISVDGVIDQMVAGRTVIHRITLPEGWTSAQLADLIAANDILTGELASVPPEGSLLPETYHFERNEDRNALIARMTAAMDATLAELWAGRADDLPLDSPEQALVLASIVEKETGIASERPHIAGVFINRLDRGMPLQSDPTVIYALTLGEAPLDRLLTRADLKTDSPYNTYVVPGLPPGPIANPGRDAIAAVLQPLETKDLYFVADGTGGHAFAETLAQHNRNVAAWRAIRDQAE